VSLWLRFGFCNSVFPLIDIVALGVVLGVDHLSFLLNLRCLIWSVGAGVQN